MFFNPENSAYRLKAFLMWYESIKHMPHRIVECSIGKAKRQLPNSPYIDHIQTNSLLWHKEALLNYIIRKLPKKYKYVAWVDTDIHFDNLNWFTDGCICGNRLSLSLAIKDLKHIQEFSKFIESSCNIYQNVPRVSVQDKFIVPQIMEKFDWKYNKTENPPNLPNMTDELFLAFFIGYIDGDGSIRRQSGRKDNLCTFQVHSSWLNIIQNFINRLKKITKEKSSDAKLNKRGYTYCTISNSKILQFLKKFIIENKLTVLDRKWDRINMDYVKTLFY